MPGPRPAVRTARAEPRRTAEDAGRLLPRPSHTYRALCAGGTTRARPPAGAWLLPVERAPPHVGAAARVPTHQDRGVAMPDLFARLIRGDLTVVEALRAELARRDNPIEPLLRQAADAGDAAL